MVQTHTDRQTDRQTERGVDRLAHCLSRYLCLPILSHDFECHRIVPEQVVGQRIAHPGATLRWPSLQQLVTSVLMRGGGEEMVRERNGEREREHDLHTGGRQQNTAGLHVP